MIQRLAGGILVIASTTGAGFLYGAQLQEYLDKLRYIRHIVYMLKGEMEYTNAPLSDVFSRTAARVKEPYRQWFLAMKTQIENREKDRFSEIWSCSVDQYLRELGLTSVHSGQLKELGDCLGQMDSRSESTHLHQYLERLELEIEKAREGITSKKRIGNCLGLMGGIFLVVILI